MVKKWREPGRNSTDKEHAYNVWMVETYGNLLDDKAWGNLTKFRSYVKHHPPKLLYQDGSFIPNPIKVLDTV